MNLSPLSTLASKTSAASVSPTTASGSNSEFNQVLLQLMGQLSSTGTSDNAFSLEMLIIPLLEKLVQQQTATNAATNSSAIAPAVPAQPEPHGSPVQGPISQGSHTGHVAIDFAVVVGTPVHATMDGKVVYSGWNNDGYGNLVIVENGSHRTYYAHNSSLPLAVGTSVHAGDVVAYSGTTGHSTGPHVHYETRVNGICVDPTSSLG
jgi:murein DD-endopeptidase MepM/ murein hydrolase activator NlpD